LKLASTIIARPRVVVLNQLYDVLSDETMLRSLELLSRVTDGGCTVIYFSNHTPPLDFDQWIVLGTETQSILESESAYLAELQARTGLPAKPGQRGPVPDF
jgi:putative ABC transport system ATP-binding protein